MGWAALGRSCGTTSRNHGAALRAIVNSAPAADDATGGVEVTDAGETATFAAGDVAYLPGSTTSELPNSGSEPAVARLVTITETGS